MVIEQSSGLAGCAGDTLTVREQAEGGREGAPGWLEVGEGRRIPCPKECLKEEGEDSHWRLLRGQLGGGWGTGTGFGKMPGCKMDHGARYWSVQLQMLAGVFAQTKFIPTRPQKNKLP